MSSFVNFDKALLDAQNSAAADLSDLSRPIKQERPAPVATKEEPAIETTHTASGSSGSSTSEAPTVKNLTNESDRVGAVNASTKKKRKKGSATAFIKDFPRDLLSVAKKSFPDANQTDALAAFVAVNSHEHIKDLPESVQALVDNWDGDKTDQDIDRRLTNLDRQMTILVGILQELELAVTYLTFDKLGYRNESAPNSRNVNFLEHGVSDMMVRLREQTKQMRTQENIKTGRPIK